MGCGCQKTKVFVHTAPDGTKTEVNSQNEAVALTRSQGGRWAVK